MFLVQGVPILRELWFGHRIKQTMTANDPCSGSTELIQLRSTGRSTIWLASDGPPSRGARRALLSQRPRGIRGTSHLLCSEVVERLLDVRGTFGLCSPREG